MFYLFNMFFSFCWLFIYYGCKNDELQSKKINQETIDSIKIQLGKKLFFDTHLSVNNTKSCASCHNPKFAFSDNYRTNTGAYGDLLLHNTPSIINASHLNFFHSDNPNIKTLAQQIKRPLYNAHPIELGLSIHINNLQYYFKSDSTYQHLFSTSFQDDSIFSKVHIEEALIAYVRTLNSRKSKYDQYMKGQYKMTATEEKGLQLFMSDRLQCATCHKPPLFSMAYYSTNIDSVYANIGLYNINNQNRYPDEDNGIYKHIKTPHHNGRFKIPSLRNVMITAPYMHDGSIHTINEIIDHYARGGTKTISGPNAGDGKMNAYKHPLIRGFEISYDERIAMIHFLHTLTDTIYTQHSNE